MSLFMSSLEILKIKDERLYVSWAPLMLMTEERFPNLRYLEIPDLAFASLGLTSEVNAPKFPKLHLKIYTVKQYNLDYSEKLHKVMTKGFETDETNQPKGKKVVLMYRVYDD